jgi:hypothetical protein
MNAIEGVVVAHDGGEECVVQVWRGGLQCLVFGRMAGLHVGDVVVLRLADAEARRGEIVRRAGAAR